MIYPMAKGGVFLQVFLAVVLSCAVLVGAAYFLPVGSINWGVVGLAPGKSLTVVGEASSKEKNQTATFTAGVNTVSDNKDTALGDSGKQVDALVAALKKFGIAEEDIKTSNLNVYQNEETYYDNGVQKSRPGQWRISKNIEVTLRDIKRVTDLAAVLTQSGANNVYGPNFGMEDVKEAERKLIGEAFIDAKSKAEVMALASGRKLGKVLSLSEGNDTSFAGKMMYGAMGGGGGGGGEILPGSAEIRKSVTVVFELR